MVSSCSAVGVMHMGLNTLSMGMSNVLRLSGTFLSQNADRLLRIFRPVAGSGAGCVPLNASTNEDGGCGWVPAPDPVGEAASGGVAACVWNAGPFSET